MEPQIQADLSKYIVRASVEHLYCDTTTSFLSHLVRILWTIYDDWPDERRHPACVYVLVCFHFDQWHHRYCIDYKGITMWILHLMFWLPSNCSVQDPRLSLLSYYSNTTEEVAANNSYSLRSSKLAHYLVLSLFSGSSMFFYLEESTNLFVSKNPNIEAQQRSRDLQNMGVQGLPPFFPCTP